MMKTRRRRAADDPLRVAERQAARAVAAGVEETLRLERGRGAAFAECDDGRERGPCRRQAGLEWLARKGRITADQRAAGERYRDAYKAQPSAAIGSNWRCSPAWRLAARR